MSDEEKDEGEDVTHKNGSGKRDRRPALTAAEIIIVAALLALLQKLIERFSK